MDAIVGIIAVIGLIIDAINKAKKARAESSTPPPPPTTARVAARQYNASIGQSPQYPEQYSPLGQQQRPQTSVNTPLAGSAPGNTLQSRPVVSAQTRKAEPLRAQSSSDLMERARAQSVTETRNNIVIQNTKNAYNEKVRRENAANRTGVNGLLVSDRNRFVDAVILSQLISPPKCRKIRASQRPNSNVI